MVRHSSVEDIASSHFVFSGTVPLLGFYLCLIFFVFRHLCGLFRYLCDPLSLSRDIFLSYLRIFPCFLFSLFLATIFLSFYLYSVYPISPNRSLPHPHPVVLQCQVLCVYARVSFCSRTCIRY
jgi:hypothetical protein